MKPNSVNEAEYFHKVVDCQWACPAHTPVPEYIRLIAAGRYSDAYMVNWESNVFPGILGRTCDRPCEPACRRGRVEDEPHPWETLVLRQESTRCGGIGGWRGSRFMPGFVYLSVCDRSDGQPASRSFPTAFPRTVRATFEAHGSPVIRFQKFSISACRLPCSLPPDRPVPLRHVSGFPGP